MKFKIIFVTFNILIVFSFLLIFLLPVFMLGSEYAGQLWKDSWYVSVIFVLILVSINVLYFYNRKILISLENENWPELKIILEKKIFEETKFRKLYIRLYISTCIASGSVKDITRLENELREKSPALMKQWALQLGLPYLIADNARQMKEYFGEFLDSDVKDSGWVKWNYCFALLMLKETDEAVSILKSVSAEISDPLLTISTIYMLSPFSNDPDVKDIIQRKSSVLKEKMKKEDFNKEIEKQRDNVQMLFLSKIIDEASVWLFNSENGSGE